MSCSKPLPPFVCDSLYYLNRYQLERFTIICLSLKNFIERYLHSKPYRFFDRLWIHGGAYALINNGVEWHPNQDGYSAQQFLAGQVCSVDRPWKGYEYYSFAEMRPYLGPTVRIKKTTIHVAGDSTYNPEHIAEMESLTYLWRDYEISIRGILCRIDAERFQPILNSPTILQCRKLNMVNEHFSFKDFNVLYTVKVIEMFYNDNENIELWQQYLQQFLEQPGVKPILILRVPFWKNVDIFLNGLSKYFSSAVVPNAFKVVFVRASYQAPLTEFSETNKTSGEKLELKKGLPTEYQNEDLDGYAFSSAVLPNAFKVVFIQDDESLTEFRETNKTSGEKLELKKGLPVEYQEEYLKKYHNYTLERSTI
ncbi:hypothetical protein DdX_19497 [Ditylenchus destructor]|uniref:Uncharacterized protein n=1 Tax=Ditylenchus destructor TaxID=166010 RepID=A0AAD4MIX2_9BILA|nr:hypothetical protein DdX_19497 [Ditylenchus destructor]